jgi:hypothetical protein
MQGMQNVYVEENNKHTMLHVCVKMETLWQCETDKTGSVWRSLRDLVNKQHLINYIAEALHSSDDFTGRHQYSVEW